MKKLLSTTAFLGALALTAGSAEAANLQVNVGGFVDFQAGYTSDDQVAHDVLSSSNENQNKVNFSTDSEIHFTVEGTADNGLEYGAVIELEADVNNTDQAQNGGTNADKAYLFGQGGWGRVELGDNTDAAQALQVNSGTFASGTGGVNGDFYRYAFATSGAGGSGFLIRPELPLANSGNGSTFNEDATKITYYSPRIAGFQAGVSYIPNSGDTGTAAFSGSDFQNVIAGGVNFTTQYNQFAIKLAATGEHGDQKSDTTQDQHLSAWNAGGNVSFAGFTVGGSYGHVGEIAATNASGVGGAATVNTVNGAHYWDAGAGYAFGPWSASATYLESKVNPAGSDTRDNLFHNLVVGTDYKLAPGLVPYAEVSVYNFNGSGGDTTVTENKGTAVIVGTQLTF